MPEVEKERGLLVCLNELDCFIRQAVGDVLAIGSVGDRTDMLTF
jgi:hypothetical protein